MKPPILSGLVLAATVSFAAQFGARANPLGGVVAAGAASISQSGGALTINQSSSRAVINWGSFNIGVGESTSFHFLGPAGGASAVLNEVSAGAGQSFINGLLNSYVGAGNHIGGTVYIYNPNGILIGSQGSVNVGSLIGTTLSLGSSSFMKGGSLSLGGPSATGGGSIQNEGQISALDGDLFLIAHNVENDGTINARNVGLAAGSYVEIKQPGQPGADRISVLAGDPSNPGGTGVNNSATGIIKAVTAELQGAGGNAYALAVNNAGVIHADALVNRGGRIYLTGNGGAVQNSGALDASDSAAGGTGGAVTVTGSQITLTGSSVIHADGQADGGTVLIGGGSRGNDPSVPDAADTAVEAGATITANAIAHGNGGKVVVFSDDTTTFAGQIMATGGAQGGNGGAAEVSGENLSITGHAFLTAPKGTAGTLLLDPGSVSIVTGPDTGPSAEMNSFNDGWVNNQLNTGSSLIIDTQNSSDGLAQNLTVQNGAAIAWNSANSLTLNGADAVTINGTIRGAGSGGLALNSANGNILINNSVAVASGGLSMTAAGEIEIGASVNIDGPIIMDNGGTVSGAGAISGTTLTLEGAGDVGTAAGALNVDVAGIELNGSGGSIWLNNGIAATSLNGLTGGSVTLAAGAVAFGATTVGGNLAVTASGPVSQTGALTVTGTTALTAGANAITLNNLGNDFGGAVTVDNSGANDVSLNNGDNSLTVNGVLGGNLTAAGAGISDGGSALTVGGTTSLTAGAANSISFANAGDSFAGAVSIQSGDNVTLADTAALAINGTVTGNLTAAGAGISDGGSALSVGGTTTLTAGMANDISFQAAGDSFGGAVGLISAHNVALDDLRSLTLNGTVSGYLNASANGIDINGPLTVNGGLGVTLNTLAGNLTVEGALTTVAANGPVNITAADIILNGGSIDSGSGLISITAAAGGTIGLGAAADLSLTGAELADITTSGGLALSTTGGASISVDGVTAANSQNITGPLTLNAPGGAVDFLSAPSFFNSLDVHSASIDLGASVTTTTPAGQVYDGAVILSGPVTLAANNGGAILFSSTVDGAQALDVETTGTATFDGAIGGAAALASLTVDATETGGLLQLDGGLISTAGPQNYGGAAVLGANTILTSTTGAGTVSLAEVILGGENLMLANAGTATLNGAISGTGALTANGAGALVVNNAVTAGALTDGEATTFNGTGGTESVITTGGQSYSASLTLNANTTLTGASLSLAAVNLNSLDLTLQNSAAASLNGAVTGTGVLTASGAGSLTVANALTAGSVTDSETTTLGGGAITTTGGQEYTGNLTLAADTTLQTGTKLALGAPGTPITLTGDGYNLTLNNAAASTLNAAISGLGVLTAAGGGLTFENDVAAASMLDNELTTFSGTGTPAAQTVTTSGSQIYNAPVILVAATTLSSTDGGNITLGSTVSGAARLDVETAGTTTFDNSVNIQSLLVDQTAGGGTIDLSGGPVLTTAGQSYDGAIFLSTGILLRDTGGSPITFGPLASVSGPELLDVETAGTTTFDAAVNVLHLSVDLTVTGGTIDLNGGSVTTLAGQVYDGAVKLSSDTLLSDLDGSDIAFGPLATISGAQSLEVETAGTTTFGGAVNLRSLTLDEHNPGGAIDLDGGSVTTSGSQSYDNFRVINLGAGTTLTSGSTLVLGAPAEPGAPAFNINGNGHSLSIINGGPATINGTVSDISSLYASTTAPLAQGNLTLNGNITTTPSGSLIFLEDTTFAKPVTLTFDTLTLGQKNPREEAEFYGPGPVIFDNSGEANLANGSLENITSILFGNPQLAFLPGLPTISLEVPATELFDAEGTAIRSAFDLARKTVVKKEPIEMEVDMRSPSVRGSILLRGGQLYRSEKISPSP